MLGIVFLFFGIEKIADPAKFSKEIMNYGFFPFFAVNLIAIILPWIEVLVGLFIILGIRIKSASLISAALMTMFIISVGIAMALGLDINCGCSASHDLKVGWQKIIENLAYLVISFYLIYFPNSILSIDNYLWHLSGK